MQLSCLIIDDEPLSQDVITDFVNNCPELALAGVCSNAIDAIAWLNTNSADLLFLDINMPRLSGINFAKSLPNPPMIIVVTAYPEFALEGFEIDAIDYLVKPVSFERFRMAVNRANDRFIKKSEVQDTTHIMVRANKKDYRINLNELLFLKAEGDYVKFVTTQTSLMVHGTLKDFINQLPSDSFERVHKSYVISLSGIVYVEGNQVKIGEYKIPVSLTYKEQLIKRLHTGK